MYVLYLCTGAMCALHVCLQMRPYMYALYVCRICTLSLSPDFQIPVAELQGYTRVGD